MDHDQFINSTAQSQDYSEGAKVTSKPKNSKPLIATSIICAILAVAGIAFGIYSFIDSHNKSTQISSLKNDITEKTNEITKLQTDLSNLKNEALQEDVEPTESLQTTEDIAETISESTTQSETNSIELLSEIADTETTKVYKIGECTADGGTGATPHFSLKCHVSISGKDALISYHDEDNNILRLSLPK